MRALRPLLPPRPRHNRRVALMPLADTMFQLLIFFMLTSGLTPYSLLGFGTAEAQAPAGRGGDGGGAGAAGETGAEYWQVGAGGVETNGQRFPFARIDPLAQALAGREPPVRIVLVAQPEARVQDIVTVMARLHAQGLSDVRLAVSPEEGG